MYGCERWTIKKAVLKAKRYWLVSSSIIVKNILHKSITVNNLTLVGMDVNTVWGLGNRMSVDSKLFLVLISWTNLRHRPLDFLTGETGVWVRKWGTGPCSFLIWALALKGFFTYRILINSAKMLWRSLWILMSAALWIFPTWIEDFFHKESGSWINKEKNDQCFQNQV